MGKNEQGDRVPALDVLGDTLTECGVTGLAETAVRGVWWLAKLTEEDAPAVIIVLWEPVLHHPVGTAEVMRAQLARLLEISERPGVLVYVLPSANGANAGLGGPVSLASVTGKPGVLLTSSPIEDVVPPRAPRGPTAATAPAPVLPVLPVGWCHSGHERAGYFESILPRGVHAAARTPRAVGQAWLLMPSAVRR